jgi:hypothetical protein
MEFTDEEQAAWDDGVRFGTLRETEYPRANLYLDRQGDELPRAVDQFIETAREYITLLEQRVDLQAEIIANQNKGE